MTKVRCGWNSNTQTSACEANAHCATALVASVWPEEPTIVCQGGNIWEGRDHVYVVASVWPEEPTIVCQGGNIWEGRDHVYVVASVWPEEPTIVCQGGNTWEGA